MNIRDSAGKSLVFLLDIRTMCTGLVYLLWYIFRCFVVSNFRGLRWFPKYNYFFMVFTTCKEESLVRLSCKQTNHSMVLVKLAIDLCECVSPNGVWFSFINGLQKPVKNDQKLSGLWSKGTCTIKMLHLVNKIPFCYLTNILMAIWP